MLKNLKLRLKILVILLFISFITAGTVGLIAFIISTNTLKTESFNKLIAIREMKANQIEDYFQQIFDEVISLSESKTVIEAILGFKKGFDALQSELNYSPEDLDRIDSALFSNYQNQFIEELLNRDSGLNFFSIPKSELIGSHESWLNVVYQDSTGKDTGLEFPKLRPVDFTGKINMSGSSTVSSLAEHVIDLYNREGARGKIDYRITGTEKGLQDLIEDPQMDIVGSSHELTSDELSLFKKHKLKPLSFRIGTDALIVVVNDKNDFIKNLSADELKQVFTTAVRWSDINPKWPDHRIRRFIPEVGTGSYKLFSELILGDESIELDKVPNTRIIKDGTHMKQAMINDPYSIAFFSNGYYDYDAHQKIVLLNGVELNNTSIRNNQYPLKRPLYLLTTEEKLKKDRDLALFINYFLNTVDAEVGTDLDEFEYWPEHINHRILQYQFCISSPYQSDEKGSVVAIDETNSYTSTHQIYHPIFKNYLDRFGHYDILLITADSGHIVYSVRKQVDFATDIMQGSFNNTGIADVFRNVMNSQDRDFIYLVDFSPYLPSLNAPASFIGTAIFDGDKKIGVLVFQLPISRINHIMTDGYNWEKVGLGKTGETFLVGDDFLLRNQSRFLVEDPDAYIEALLNTNISNNIITKIISLNSTIGLQPVISEGALAALRGETGYGIFPDYHGMEVLSTYKPLNLDQVNWIIMSEIGKEEAFSSIAMMLKQFLFWFLAILFVAIVLSVIFSRSLTKPVHILSQRASDLALGNLDDSIIIDQKDEIGLLAEHFEKMRRSIKVLVSNLREINLNLEEKVGERTREIEKQKINITDSIHYASRIQSALLPSEEEVKSLLPSYFVLNRPKDIVSGDYYWLSKPGNKVVVAVADCTGHGVPGAFMSILGINFLNEIVSKSETISASDVLNELRTKIIKSLRQTGEKDEARDGMEMALCVVDFDNMKMQYSGAFRPLYLIRNMELHEFKADKMPISIYYDREVPFNNKELFFENDDIIYLFTDGYVDQLGGPNRKTFRSKKFKQLLLNIHKKPLEEQKTILTKEFVQWSGNVEQIDDVLVMGVKFGPL